jgi:hypothetical protein
MTAMSSIVTSSYRPERAPRKRKPRTYPEDMPLIVSPGPMKKRRKGPVIRLQEHQANDNAEQPRRSAIVEPKRKPNAMLTHLLDHDESEEEHRRRGDLAHELFRKIVRAASKRD